MQHCDGGHKTDEIYFIVWPMLCLIPHPYNKNSFWVKKFKPCSLMISKNHTVCVDVLIMLILYQIIVLKILLLYTCKKDKY
ncbi:MAG: hypothetical protein DRH32_10100 [Deltaproteobacteria bacterium]|nr:MAG: hypothetical protein DRH32_10100 [Deltaproteobacteria bacterium]